MTNEPAERLQSHIRAGDDLSQSIEYHADLLMQALAEERRATVERIKDAAIADVALRPGVQFAAWLAILDAERDR